MAPAAEHPTPSEVSKKLIGLIKNLTTNEQLKLIDFLNEWNVKGKRAHHRKECMMEVDYASDTKFLKDFIQDISVGGLFIETREPLSVGKEISITFSIPKTEIPFRVKGKIIRKDEQGVGVEFKNITRYQQEILGQLLNNL